MNHFISKVLLFVILCQATPLAASENNGENNSRKRKNENSSGSSKYARIEDYQIQIDREEAMRQFERQIGSRSITRPQTQEYLQQNKENGTSILPNASIFEFSHNPTTPASTTTTKTSEPHRSNLAFLLASETPQNTPTQAHKPASPRVFPIPTIQEQNTSNVDDDNIFTQSIDPNAFNSTSSIKGKYYKFTISSFAPIPGYKSNLPISPNNINTPPLPNGIAVSQPNSTSVNPVVTPTAKKQDELMIEIPRSEYNLLVVEYNKIKGDKALLDRRWSEALKMFEDVKKLISEPDPNILIKSALCKLNLNDPNGALNDATASLKILTNNQAYKDTDLYEQVYKHIRDCYIQLGDYIYAAIYARLAGAYCEGKNKLAHAIEHYKYSQELEGRHIARLTEQLASKQTTQQNQSPVLPHHSTEPSTSNGH